MNELDITSANATIILTVDNLYPTGVKLEHFSADSAWTVEDAVVSEARMGVDGHLAAGYTPTPRLVTITLEANSPSHEVMSNLLNSMQLNMGIYTCHMHITIPSINKEFYLKKGVLTQGHQISNGEKILGTTTWQFTFESCSTSSI